MEDQQFDDLARRLAAGTSRRGLVKAALAGLVGGLAGLTGVRSTVAATACTSGRHCPSRICRDGYCCDRSCTGQCEACNVPGREGVCSPVVGNPAAGRPACSGTGVCKGACTGHSRTSCAYPGSDVSCGAATCANGAQTTFACGGNGAGVPATTSCGLSGCGPNGCLTSCTSSTQCVGAAFCANGVCRGDQPLGQPCAGPDQCQSGFCADGVCCHAPE